MIRVRLADPQYRRTIATFFRLANLVVSYPEGDAHTLCIDFAAFDFDEEAQLRIVTRMLEAWQTERQNTVLSGTEIAVA
jgi:hypothetical protein